MSGQMKPFDSSYFVYDIPSNIETPTEALKPSPNVISKLPQFAMYVFTCSFLPLAYESLKGKGSLLFTLIYIPSPWTVYITQVDIKKHLLHEE